jgi:hypothetical protein
MVNKDNKGVPDPTDWSQTLVTMHDSLIVVMQMLQALELMRPRFVESAAFHHYPKLDADPVPHGMDVLHVAAGFWFLLTDETLIPTHEQLDKWVEAMEANMATPLPVELTSFLWEMITCDPEEGGDPHG